MVIAARIQLLPAVIDITHVFAFSGAGGVLTTFIAAALRLPPDRLARLTVLGNPADATGRAERVRPTLSVVSRAVPAVLSIAGSDSGGGAGIQADLKAFARCGVHGMTAITALTAQNTVGVTGVHPVPGAFVVEQVRAVAGDIGVDAVKIGMLGTAEIVAAVDEALDLLEPGTPVVIDPVMVSESGAELLDAAARAALIDTLLPRATVITPNLPEARALAGEAAPDDVADLARALHALGPDVVVITGGHREEATDVLFLGAGGPPRARLQPAPGGARRARDRRRRRPRRAARDRAWTRAGRRYRTDRTMPAGVA